MNQKNTKHRPLCVQCAILHYNLIQPSPRARPKPQEPHPEPQEPHPEPQEPQEASPRVSPQPHRSLHRGRVPFFVSSVLWSNPLSSMRWVRAGLRSKWLHKRGEGSGPFVMSAGRHAAPPRRPAALAPGGPQSQPPAPSPIQGKRNPPEHTKPLHGTSSGKHQRRGVQGWG